MAEHQDYTIEINYAVYQKRNGRLVGIYSCRCVAEDVVKYLDFKYLVQCFIKKEIKEI